MHQILRNLTQRGDMGKYFAQFSFLLNKRRQISACYLRQPQDIHNGVRLEFISGNIEGRVVWKTRYGSYCGIRISYIRFMIIELMSLARVISITYT